MVTLGRAERDVVESRNKTPPWFAQLVATLRADLQNAHGVAVSEHAITLLTDRSLVRPSMEIALRPTLVHYEKPREGEPPGEPRPRNRRSNEWEGEPPGEPRTKNRRSSEREGEPPGEPGTRNRRSNEIPRKANRGWLLRHETRLDVSSNDRPTAELLATGVASLRFKLPETDEEDTNPAAERPVLPTFDTHTLPELMPVPGRLVVEVALTERAEPLRALVLLR